MVLEQVFDAKTVEALADDVERVYEEYPPDERSARYPPEHWEPFRYEMLNRSAAVQQAIANRRSSARIEPLLGEDCHVIANTAWWQPPDNNNHGGRFWHIDSGPHVPRRRASPGTSASPTRSSPSRPTSTSGLPAQGGTDRRHPAQPHLGPAAAARPHGRRRPRVGRRASPSRSWPRRATSLSSSPTSGTADCHRAR